jgi:hypothetical protein
MHPDHADIRPPPEGSTTARPLRFGILCNSLTLSAWQAACLDELTAGGLATPVLVIVNDAPAEARPSLPQRAWRATRDAHLLWRLYRRALMKRLPAARAVDMSTTLSAVPMISCSVERRGKFSEYFREADVERIRAHQLDFMIRFGFGIIRGAVLDAARFGVWSYHHGDLEKYRGMPPGFWEIFHGDPVSGVTLQRLTDRLDGGVVLHKGHFKTIEKSYRRSLDNAMMASTGFPARVARDIHAGVASYVDAPPSTTKAPIFYAPRNAEMLRFFVRTAMRRLGDMKGWLFHHAQWNVGIVDQPIHAFLAADFKPQVHWLPEPAKDRFVADPFALAAKDGGLTVLVEEYDFNTAKGHLSVTDWRKGGPPGGFARMMSHPVHLSYPYTFEHEGGVYCIPEMSQANRVELYRATDFPMAWERVATLLEGFDAVDATVFQHEGRWWMFCARTHQNQWIKLYAFHAEQLTGPWQPHTGNPLKTDIRSSRPAGTPFVHEGRLYRPAQDCSRAYGGAVSINLVSRLTPTEFEESVCRVFALDEAEPYSAGCHTLSAAGGRTVIDGKRLIFQPSEFRREVGAILRRLVPAALRRNA